MTEAFSGLTILLLIMRVATFLAFPFVMFILGIFAEENGFGILPKKNNSFASVFAVGFISVAALSQLILVPFVLYNVSVNVATVIWWVLFGSFSIFTVIKYHRRVRQIIKASVKGIHRFFIKEKCGGVYGAMATILVAFQVIASIALYHYDDDDAFYVTSVVSNLADNQFFRIYGETGEPTALWKMSEYITNGWYSFQTIVSNSTKIPPAILMHTVLSILMLAFAYSIYTIFAKLVIKNVEQRHLFIMFCSVINILNNVSTHTSSSVLLMRIHQGKAIFVNIVVPVMICIFYLLWNSYEDKRNYLLLLLTNLAACYFTTSGLVFGAILIAVYAIVITIRKKNIRVALYSMITLIPSAVYVVIYYVERTYEVWS